ALSMNILDFVPEDERQNTRLLLKSIVNGDFIHSSEAHRLSKSGRKITVLLTITPLFDKAGKVVAIASTEKNISRRIEAENKLRASEASFRVLVESAPDALVIVNIEGKIEVANSQAERLFGYKKQELIGMPVDNLMPPKFSAGHIKHRQAFFSTPIVRGMANGTEVFALTKSGEEIPVEVGLSPIETEHGQVVSAAIRDIRQRQSADEALRAAKDQAESALSAKSRFLATASHDLRQPLHSLTLLNKALLKTIKQPQAREMLRIQGDSLFSMARLLNSLLDISKLESGTVAAQMSDFALRPMLEQICAGFEAEVDENRLELSLEINDDSIVHSDPGLMAQLLQNLIANAIRYTKVGKVSIATHQHDMRLKISVSDTGIGIPSDQQRHIFDEFHQVDRNPQQRHSGLGLGLSIVQRIATLLDTSVEVISEVGQGSTFSITLPLGESLPDKVQKRKTINLEPKQERSLILLIDDDPDVLNASEMLLSMEADFDIRCASSPPEAYAAMDKELPNLIITDFHLNHKESGMDIIAHANSKDGHQIPAILVSGDTSPEMENIPRENLEVMTKPINPAALITKARQLLGQIRHKSH
ncbi:MAG: PAS domain S-box-containing protein, partial [Paraglaciecola sp.]